MMESVQTIEARALTCPRDSASFREQDAARLCVHCHEPFLPRTSQFVRCSSCGAEGNNGRLTCECANGRLQASGYRCPSCLVEGGDEMLAGQLACPYCFHALELSEASAARRAFPVRRLAGIAALCLVVVASAAAAYIYGAPLIHSWLEPAQKPSPNPQATNQPPSHPKPPAGHAAPPDPDQEPQIAQLPAAAPAAAPGQPAQQPGAQVVMPQPPNGSGLPGGEQPAQLKPAIIDAFTASAQTIQRGSSVTLHWEVTGDNPTVSLLPGIGAVPATGSWEVRPQTTQQYTLTATNAGESTPQIRSVMVIVVPQPPVTIVSFTAAPSQLQPGQTTTLRWNVLGASRVRIDPGVGDVGATGSATVRPQGNTAYVLTASGAGGTKTAALPISLAAPSSSGPAAFPSRRQPPASGQIPFPSSERNSQALELLAAVQNAMGGKKNLEAIRGWRRAEKITWEMNYGTTIETTTFFAPSDIRIESQGASTTIDESNGIAGWTWSSMRPVRSAMPAATATGMPFRELPDLVLSDDDPGRTVSLAGPSTLLITDRRNDRVYLKVDPSSHLPQAIAWMNLDGSELEETYSNWRPYAGVLWWGHMTRSRNRQEFLRADVTGLQVK